MSAFYLSKCVEQFPETDELDVVFFRNSHLSYRAKVLHKRANPLYGTTGDLPDVGEVGVVLKVDDYGQEYFWLGSYHDSCDNLCTNDAAEFGRKLVHHESDVYNQVLKDGTVEFSHPSGTYLKLGSQTNLRARNRFQRLDGTCNERLVTAYPNRQDKPIFATINHTWVNGGMSGAVYDTDARKQTMQGDLRNTSVILDPVGNVNLDHQTTAGTHMKIWIDPDGNLDIESNIINITGINGATTAVTINGTLHTTQWIHGDTDIVGNMVYDINGNYSMLGMRSDYNPHVHLPSDVTPTPSMG